MFLGQLSTKHKDVKEAPALMQIPMIILSVITILFGILPNLVLRVISNVQTSVGIEPLILEGTRIQGSNGVIDPTLIVIIFGIGVFDCAYTVPAASEVKKGRPDGHIHSIRVYIHAGAAALFT